MSAAMWNGRQFDTLFIGGGTPTSVNDEYIERILEKVDAVYSPKFIEATVEANPGTVDWKKLQFYRYMGIDRISFGVQAAQDWLLQAVGRIHDFDEAKESIALACRAGFKNISVDIMSGLPDQRKEDLLDSVNQADKLCATHISMYTLKLEEGTPLYKSVKSGKTQLPSKDDEYEMAKAARERLAQMGYLRYEISNYAKPGFECLHNLHYWHNDDYLGLGLSAASSLNGLRTTNTRIMSEYIEKIHAGNMPYAESEQSSEEEYAFETLMLGLRLVEGVDMVAYKSRHGIDIMQRLGAEIESLKNRGLADIYEGRLCLTEQGLDLQNTVLVELMEKYNF
jgi:oxygen-independent coproporphyrinogen-3 oxidase